MDKAMFIKVVDKNNKEFLVSPDKIKVGDKTLLDILKDLKICKEDILKLQEQNKEKDKTLQDLLDKVNQVVSFSMES